MLVDLNVFQPSTFENLSNKELRSNINSVLNGHLPGFVIAASMEDAFQQSIAYAKELGLVGDLKSTTIDFDYDYTSDTLTSEDSPGGEDWEDLGVTPLHVDGQEGTRMLSISKALEGAYDIMIFGRGPKITRNTPIELWNTLQEENMGILLNSRVDTEMLTANSTRLAVSAGQTVIFNPSQPHMGITRSLPRRASTTFFHAQA